MIERAEVLVLGAGMAGASLAAHLAPHLPVVLLDTEPQAGRHATGRSAAMYFESYGNETIRALTRASRTFFEHPPPGWVDHPLLSPRAGLFIADTARADRLRSMLDGPNAAPGLRLVNAAQAMALVPILRSEALAGGVIDDTGHDIDVGALHQGCLRRARQHGARLVLDAADQTLERHQGLWRLSCRAGVFEAPLVVNATGAWADRVARLAGATPVGLQALRRSAILVESPAGVTARDWPLVIDVDESFYFKPDAGRLLVSPANEDPMPPCDAVPQELDVAVAVDRFERATTVRVRRVLHRWAGLRSFVADRTPVVGFDPVVAGFFWLAGQGGYGIQTAPAMARAAAALVLGRSLPADLIDEGVTAQALAPSRPALQPRARGDAPERGAGQSSDSRRSSSALRATPHR